MRSKCAITPLCGMSASTSGWVGGRPPKKPRHCEGTLSGADSQASYMASM